MGKEKKAMQIFEPEKRSVGFWKPPNGVQDGSQSHELLLEQNDLVTVTVSDRKS